MVEDLSLVEDRPAHSYWVLGTNNLMTSKASKYEENLSTGERFKQGWMRHWRKILVVAGIPLVVLIVLLLVAVVRTAIKSHAGIPVPPELSLDKAELIDRALIEGSTERLQQALRINTTSGREGEQDLEGILKMHVFLEESFPQIRTSAFIKREVINNYSLLYTVEGSVPGKLPYLLASHLDVVPANPASWEVPPFSGQVVNKTYVYGRGAMDDKAGVMAILEAIEHMLLNGQRPKRSFYLAFGHDKETGGNNGAKSLAAALYDRGIKVLDFILDEGLPITIGIMKETDRQVAMIGVAEKGYAEIELSVKGTPGHSSLPPKETAIGILGEAVSKLEANPQPAHIDNVQEDTFKYLMPYMEFSTKFLYTNLWLFSKRVITQLGEEPVTNALIRTTTAVTSFEGVIKSNESPPSAKAVINHRVLPSKLLREATEHDKRVIDDRRVNITILHQREASHISPYSSDDAVHFQLIATSIKQVYPEAVVVPSVFIGNTDTQWYTNFTTNIYRFLPTVASSEDMLRYHGNNERISTENYHQAVNFYYRVVKNADLMVNKVPLNADVNPTGNTNKTATTNKMESKTKMVDINKMVDANDIKAIANKTNSMINNINNNVNMAFLGRQGLIG